MSLRNYLRVNAGALGRRQLIQFAGIAASVKSASAGDDPGISRAAEAIHQEPVFKASRKRIYQVLTDPKQFDKAIQTSEAMRTMALGNKPTELSDKVGSAFTLFRGHIVGRQIELVPDTRIVQAWRVVDWSPGVYSMVKFELTGEGSDTKIIFDHTGFPSGKAEHLAAGWSLQYWEPLRKYLA